MHIGNKDIAITGKIVKIARIYEEWYDDLDDPELLISALKEAGSRPDIFTFWQRLPETTKKYDYYSELDSIAALPITNFDEWWEKQIDAKTRNVARKAEKKGVEIKMTKFDDEFVKGMVSIFNETPIRQGKPFWHYGKNFDAIKEEFARNAHREEIIGAYYQGELVGFIFLASAGKYAMTTQIISKLEHRDKSPTNALLAKAVQRCAEKGVAWLVYAKWPEGSLGDFKRHNGFQKIDLPRYYVPLTIKGALFLKFKLHHGVKGILPKSSASYLKALRTKWYSLHTKD